MLPSLSGSTPHLSREEARSEIHVFCPTEPAKQAIASYARLCMRLLCDLEPKHDFSGPPKEAAKEIRHQLQIRKQGEWPCWCESLKLQ